MTTDRTGSRQALLEELRDLPSGAEWCHRHTHLCDEVIRELATEDGALYAVIATGGYGRRELAPFSDIDITIVPVDDANPEVDRAIRQLYRSLHAVFLDLGLEVGYAYRLVSDAPGLDAVSRTALLDMRLVAGNASLFHSLRRALDDSLSPGEFIVEKIREREAAFVKYNDSPLVVEAQIKEGAGGLRCRHVADWIRACIGERSAAPTEAYERMLMVRNLLHLASGKRQDLLSRGRQETVGGMLGLDGFRVASQVAADGVELHRDYCQTLERLHEARFSLASGVLALRGEVRLDGNVDPAQAAVGVATATRLRLRVPDVRMVPHGPVDGPTAAYALSMGEATLRNLDRAGLLDELLPELTACRMVVPEEGHHTWTVFEHTMRVVRHIDSLHPGNFLGDVRESVSEPEALYLAALLHDVGKRFPELDHSSVGAEIAREIGKRWGLGEDVVENVAWLVREHLVMSRFIRIRDLMRPETIDEFAAIVGNVDRLAMLTILTWADASSVADGTWTAAQDTFQHQLYHKTAARLQDDWVGPDPNSYRRKLARQLNAAPEESGFEEFLEKLPASYLLATSSDAIRLHYHYVISALQGDPTVDFYARPELSASDVTVAAIDRPGLLSDLLGVFYAHDISVQAIRAATIPGDQPVAIDVFTLAFGGKPVPAATAVEARNVTLRVLRGEASVDEILKERGKDPDRKQSIFRYTYTEGEPGVLEIRAPRGRGMAYRFSRLISAQGWNVTAARVGQWGGSGAAAFYIVGPDGRAIPHGDVDHVLGST